MDVSIHAWDDIDVHELAAVYAACNNLQKEEHTLLVRKFQNWEYDTSPVVICVHSDKTLKGWLMLHITSPTMVEINPGPFGGHPVVLPGSDSAKIRSVLIREALTYATREKFTKIDLTVPMGSNTSKDLYKTYGFEPFYFCMVCTLSDEIRVTLPEGFKINHTSDVDEDDLYMCYYHAFSAGEAQFFFDQTEDEKRKFFSELASTGTMDEECSLVLMKEQVVGFTYVVQYGKEGNCHLNLICIHPDFQGLRLGEMLLRLTMRKAARQYETMTLYTEADTSALELYRACGFKKGGGNITYIYTTGV